MTAAIYVRVSTASKQDETNQLPECEALAQRRGYEVVEVYRERVSAVKRAKRLEWRRVLEDAQRGRFEVLVVWSLDRLGRDFMTNILDVKRLDDLGVLVVSVHDGWLDTTTGFVRDILLGIFSAVAQAERDRLVERINAGIARARAQGKRLGRPRERPSYLAVASLRQRGLSWREIAAKLRCPVSTARDAVAERAVA
jgi:DNA invertase Pin-like site-specific DNA recombinase